MGDALWFELGEDLGRFSINEFCLITGLNCEGSTHLPVVESRLISRYFRRLEAYETLPSIASKFTTKYDQAISRMMSWTTADNVMFDDVLAAFTTLKCFVLMPTEEELKNTWVARLFLKNPNALPQLPPPKSSVPRPNTDTNSE
ncbi:hypothetical protein TIFTF001_051002 [Ficus carica]|uniref:Uncharacterized protein n=1 Tax=Ficus carica TaxID=3494 RepID=A0AA88CHL1_FICCA|nr:hypothetical protein TIFTF001_051002 [Ficus carica]